MADGSRSQRTFNFPRLLPSALRSGEIVVDLFAGGGGASEALKQALGRDPDIAINHDEWAVGMHAANHPLTQHLREDVWHADPVRQVDGRAVGWFHASPDCTHFSQAKGGQPRSRATRSLSWVVLKWAGSLAKAGRAPRIISLENVEQILKWGPLIAKRDKATGRVLKLDGTIAAKGERVSVWEQSLIPDKRHAGRTWGQFVAALRAIGYTVEWRKLIASDFGAGTSRKRLFLVARFDTTQIQWPAPTHGKGPGLLPLVTAADCLDFSIPCPSIFTRKKPLAEATMRRVAKGVKRYVIDAAEPFIVGCGGRMGQSSERGVSQPMQTLTAKADSCLAMPTLVPLITEHANSTAARSWPASEPLRTQCANVKGGHFALVTTQLQPIGDTDGPNVRNDQDRGTGLLHAAAVRGEYRSERTGFAHNDQENSQPGADNLPVDFICRNNSAPGAPVSGGRSGGIKTRTPATSRTDPQGFQAATLIQTGYGEREGQAPRALDIGAPLGTIVGGGVKHAVVAAFLEQANTGMVGHDARDPMSTIVGAGSTQRLVQADLAQLSPDHEAGALRVAAFLIKYYGTANGVDLRDPLDTITTRDRLALVTVTIHGTPYVIVDIGLRMLRREELFRAQGFPADYIIDRTADGRPLSISRSVRMVGNSVSPPPLLAIARANLAPIDVSARLAA